MMISILITLTGFACMLVFYQTYALHFVRRKSMAQEETELP